jgi:hypothetical protein
MYAAYTGINITEVIDWCHVANGEELSHQVPEWHVALLQQVGFRGRHDMMPMSAQGRLYGMNMQQRVMWRNPIFEELHLLYGCGESLNNGQEVTK